MSDNLEDRLRRAFEAHAAQVEDADLDHRRTDAVRPEHAVGGFRWGSALFAAGGLAAAAVVGVVVLSGQNNDTGRPLADPPMASTSSSTPRSPSSVDAGTGTPAPPSETPSTRVTTGRPSTAEASGHVTSRSTGARTAPATARPEARSGQERQGTRAAPTAQSTTVTDSARAESSSSTPSSSSPPVVTSAAAPAATTGPPTTEAQATTDVTALSAIPVTVRTTASNTAQGHVAWRAHVSGPVSSAAEGDGLMGYQVSYGDGRTESREITGSCAGPADGTTLQRTLSGASSPYRTAGTYQVTVTVRWCSPSGVERSSTDVDSILVPEGPRGVDPAPSSPPPSSAE